jgi:hypothetical protein
MRIWGLVITLVYVLIVALLYGVGTFILAGGVPATDDSEFMIIAASSTIALLLLCQVALLVVTVDGERKWLRQRRPIWLAVLNISLSLGILTVSILFAIWAAVAGDEALDFLVGTGGSALRTSTVVFVCIVGLWAFWALVFRRYRDGGEHGIARLFRWLYGGSVLELLVVVPCHVIVRSRGDCCAPFLTGYGIATGLAVMLLGFGPGVIYLYQKRLAGYRARASVSEKSA